MKKLTVFLMALFLVIVMFLIGCGSTEAEKGQYERALEFEAKDIDGNVVRLSDYSGKVIILNFFATWCPPCSAEMPDLNEIAKEYEDRVKIIAVNIGKESLSVVRSFVDANRLMFPVIIDDGKISGKYGPIRAIPVTVVIDKDFNIARRYVGMRTKDVFVSDIEGLL